MTTAEKLLEAEGDLDTLIHRSLLVLPTLRHAVADVTDWRKDIRKTLLENLEVAVEQAREHQIRRRRE
jgi:hypothetical protein